MRVEIGEEDDEVDVECGELKSRVFLCCIDFDVELLLLFALAFIRFASFSDAKYGVNVLHTHRRYASCVTHTQKRTRIEISHKEHLDNTVCHVITNNNSPPNLNVPCFLRQYAPFHIQTHTTCTQPAYLHEFPSNFNGKSVN